MRGSFHSILRLKLHSNLRSDLGDSNSAQGEQRKGIYLLIFQIKLKERFKLLNYPTYPLSFPIYERL